MWKIVVKWNESGGKCAEGPEELEARVGSS